jgi:glycosyltransferase family protein
MKMSIVIPCYNEEKNIPLILERFRECIKNEEIEIILVNNGSNDNTDKVLKELLPKYTFARSVYVPINQGYGYGIIQGLKETKGKFIGWTHADMQATPKDVLKSYSILEENYWNKNLFIKGTRKKRPFFKVLVTLGMSLFESILFRSFLYDIGAQPNFFHRDFFKLWDENYPKDFALDTYALYMAKKEKLDIKRYNIQYSERTNGEAFFGTGWTSLFNATSRMIKSTLKLKKNLKNKKLKG